MATLQYVGARYVPVFYNNPDGSWDWESGVSYEPLTMVKYGTNTYTSKSQVPATVGSPNENPLYWAQTGDYNGAILNLEKKVSNIDVRERKRFVFIGDSYNSTPAIGSWVELAMSYMGIPMEDYYNFATPEGGFVKAGQNGTYLTMLQNNIGSIQSPETITNVVITSAYNDTGSSVSAILSNCNELCSYIRSHFPYCTISIGFIGCLSWLNQNRFNQAMNILKTFRTYTPGGNLLNNVEHILLLADSNIVSGYHPTPDGAKYLATQMVDALNTGSCTPYMSSDIFSTIPMSLYVKGGNVFVSIGTIRTSLSVDIPANNIVQIGTYQVGPADGSHGFYSNSCMFNVDISPTAQSHNISVLYVGNGKISILCPIQIPAGTDFNVNMPSNLNSAIYI